MSPLLVHRQLRAVGVERSAAVAEEAQRRARVLGVADRVEIRVADACELPEIASFDTAYWSQPFFSSLTRTPAMGAALRVLRPGGVLVAPVLVEPPAVAGSAGARAWSIEVLVFDAWGIPVRSPSALCEEIGRAGFVDGSVVEAPSVAIRPASVLGIGHYVVARKPSISDSRPPTPIGAGVRDTPVDPVAAAALDAYVASRPRLTAWIAATEAVALLDAALSSGVLAALVKTVTLAAAADRAGIDAARMGRISAALATHGILNAAVSHHRLAAGFEALASEPTRAALSSLLGPLTTRLQAP